ncbi:HisA/HisF-related TIM barrel protein [Flavobacteriaceae bacterium]|nr:HisA/HisF-related TIM barrel protein [Flavobacteriaceae bacterium]
MSNHPRSRFIPVLLYSNKGFVKTFNFKNPKYLGDPINVIKIFNEKKANEITIFDIDASSKGTNINFDLLKRVSRESRMPVCYGGGVKDVETAEKLLSIGIEKISLSSGAILDTTLIKKISNKIGKQSVVITLDVKKKWTGSYEIYINNGQTNTGISLSKFLSNLDYNFVGEVCIISIDKDGTNDGYDLSLIKKHYDDIKSNATFVGGCNSIDEIANIFKDYSPIGLGASTYVVLKGKFKAVLISYPTKELNTFHGL